MEIMIPQIQTVEDAESVLKQLNDAIPLVRQLIVRKRWPEQARAVETMNAAIQDNTFLVVCLRTSGETPLWTATVPDDPRKFIVAEEGRVVFSRYAHSDYDKLEVIKAYEMCASQAPMLLFHE